MIFIGRYEKRGKGYRLKAYDGYDANGKQITRTKTWVPDAGMTEKQIEKEVNRQLILFEEEVRSGTFTSTNIKFEVMAESFFEQIEIEGKMKQLWRDRLKNCKARTYQAIGHIRMDKITTMDVQKFINSLAQDGINKRTGKGLAEKTQKHYISFISDVFEFAKRCNIKVNNPCHDVHAISTPKTKRNIYEPDEAQQFLNILLEKADIKYVVFYLIAIFTGLRKDEILGLEWSDIDFDNCIISVNRTSLYSVNKGTFTDTPKTDSGYRSLKVPESVIEIIQQYKEHWENHRTNMGDLWNDTDRLFVAYDGKPMGPDTPRHWLVKFCKKEGLRYVNVHSFRHLNATLMIEAGTDAKTAADMLGHSKPTTTFNIYAHAFKRARAKASEAVANSFSIDIKD